MNNSWARPGVRCVCIEDRLVDIDTGTNEHHVAKDEIYKIVAVEFCDGYDHPFLGLWRLPLNRYIDARAFRPLVETDDDASADTALFLKIAAHASDLESERA